MIRPHLRGVGQIVFQEDPVTGLCFLVGVAINSLTGAIGMALGSILGTLTARALGYRREEIRAGLFGFNGALVGVGVFALFPAGPWPAVMLAVGAPASAVLMRGMQRLPLPPFTAPFVLVTWGLWVAGTALGLPSAEAMSGPTEASFVGTLFTGIGQIMFQESMLSGAVFLAGIMWSARRSGAWACAGAAAGTLAWVLLRCDPRGQAAGLAGYNGALAGVALGSEQPRGFAPVVAGAATVPLVLLFQVSGIPALTAPFVLASWLVLWLGPMVPWPRGVATQ